MPKDHDVVIGFFGFIPPANVVCDGDACIISGSEKSFRNYLQIANASQPTKINIRRTTFGEVLRGMTLGAAYSFDEEAYGRFYPAAKRASLDVPVANFKTKLGKEIELMSVRIKGRHNQAL